MTVLFVQTCILANHNENNAVVEDATNLMREAFAPLARDTGSSSASFHVENGVVAHRHSTAPNCGYGSANGNEMEEVGSGSLGNMWTDGGELGSWPEFSFAWGKHSSASSSRKGHAALRRPGGFWDAVRRLEGSETISYMV